MAFQIYNWSEVSTSLNQGLVSAAVATPSSDAVVAQGSMNVFSYYSATDALATIEASNYFNQASPNSVMYSVQSQDIIFVTGTDASVMLQVDTVTLPSDGDSGTITTQSFTPAGSVGTSNIQALAVTAAKIANNTITSAQVAANAFGFDQLSNTVAKVATVTLSAAQFNGMYATPVLLLAAQGAGTLVLVDKIEFDMAYVSAQYAAGGVVAAQYGNTVNGAGPAATATIAAASFTGVTASSQLTSGSAQVLAANTACLNTALYISNATAAFTTGDSTFNVYIYYKVLTPA